MKTLLTDIILLCKGYYDETVYPTTHDAICAYYKQNYSDSIDFDNWEKAMFEILMKRALTELVSEYPDRLRAFMFDCIIDGHRYLTGTELQTDYITTMYHKTISFFNLLRMRGGGVKEIDTSCYFSDKRLIEPIVK